MKIYFDMDDVGNECNKELCNIYNKEFNDNFDFCNSEFSNMGDNKDIKVDDTFFVELLHQEGFFLNLEPVPGYINLIKRLVDENYEVRILTQPTWTSPYCMNEKVEWIKRHLPFFNLDYIIFTRLKGEVGGKDRILIDDNPRNLKEWEENGGIGICYGNYKYSQKWHGYKTTDFDEIYRIIKKIEK